MSWNFNCEKPIFMQIVDILTLKIIKGEYKTGERIETVRELALTAGVNPNTVQRAFAEIEEIGLIYTKRGDGRFVTEDTKLLASFKENYVSEKVSDFLNSMSEIGIDANALTEIIRKKKGE